MKVNKKSGFTLIELLLTIIVIGILSSIIISSIVESIQKSKNVQIISELKNVERSEIIDRINCSIPQIVKLMSKYDNQILICRNFSSGFLISIKNGKNEEAFCFDKNNSVFKIPSQVQITDNDSCIVCSRNVYNCSFFKTQKESQKIFDYCRELNYYDPHDLDRGGVLNKSCESLI